MVTPLEPAVGPKSPQTVYARPPEDEMEDAGGVDASPAVYESKINYPGTPSPDGDWDGDDPPPPDAFAPGLEYGGYRVELQQVGSASGPEVPAISLAAELTSNIIPDNLVTIESEVSPLAQTEDEPPVVPVREESPLEETIPPVVPDKPVALQVTPVNPPFTGGEPFAERPPYLVSPIIPQAEGNVRMLTIVLRSTGDKTRDVLRLRRIHGIVTSYPGNDRFAFRVFERNRGYLLEFPNHTIGICAELSSRLSALLGPEQISIESITFL